MQKKNGERKECEEKEKKRKKVKGDQHIKVVTMPSFHILKTTYVGFFEPLNLNLSITSVIYLKACSYFVHLDVWIVGVENMKMIDDEI